MNGAFLVYLSYLYCYIYIIQFMVSVHFLIFLESNHLVAGHYSDF